MDVFFGRNHGHNIETFDIINKDGIYELPHKLPNN